MTLAKGDYVRLINWEYQYDDSGTHVYNEDGDRMKTPIYVNGHFSFQEFAWQDGELMAILIDEDDRRIILRSVNDIEV